MGSLSFCISASTSQLRFLDTLFQSLSPFMDDCEILVDLFNNDDSSSIQQYTKRLEDFIKDGVKLKFRVKLSGYLGESRNWMINNASSEYLLFIDGDDFINPDGLIGLLQNLDRGVYSDCPVIVFKAQTVNDDSTTGWHSRCYPNRLYLSRVEMLDWFEKGGWRLTSACVKVYQKSWLIENNLIFNEDFYYEDTPFWFEVIFNSNKIAFYNSEIYMYRRWSPNQITGDGGKKLFDIFGIIELMEINSRHWDSIEMEIAFHNFILDHLFWTAERANNSSLSPKNISLLHQLIDALAKKSTSFLKIHSKIDIHTIKLFYLRYRFASRTNLKRLLFGLILNTATKNARLVRLILNFFRKTTKKKKINN